MHKKSGSYFSMSLLTLCPCLMLPSLGILLSHAARESISLKVVFTFLAANRSSICPNFVAFVYLFGSQVEKLLPNWYQTSTKLLVTCKGFLRDLLRLCNELATNLFLIVCYLCVFKIYPVTWSLSHLVTQSLGHLVT